MYNFAINTVEEYEIFDQILDYVLNGGFGSARNMQHDGLFANVDPARISQWVKQMQSLAPADAFVLKTAGGNMPGLWRTDYTHLFKEDGGFKALVEKQRKQQRPVKITFQRADGNNPLADLHPAIQKASSAVYADGHLREAVLNAFIALDQEVARIAGLDKFGSDLMQLVFSPKNPILKLSSVSTEQQGFMYLFAGSMMALRNPNAHKLEKQPEPQQALEWLSYASALFRLLDSASSTEQ